MKKYAIFLYSLGFLIVFSVAVIAVYATTNTHQPIFWADELGLELREYSLKDRLVAHAGGSVNGYVGSNSLEALQQSVELGFTLIEVDLITTTDGQIVALHSWETQANRIPGAANTQVSHSQFMEYRIFNQFTPIDLGVLIEFMSQNPHIRIITDTKATDYAALYAIVELYPEFIPQFIPQVYDFQDVEYFRRLGFERIIAATYMMPPELINNPTQIGRLARRYGVYAITIPDWIFDEQYASLLGADTVRAIIHTVDSVERAYELLDMGAYGLMTAFLSVDEYGNLIDFFAPILQEKLDVAQKRETLSHGLFLQVNTPYFINNGQVMLIGTQERMAAPFFYGGEIFVPLAATAIPLGGTNYTWHPDLRAVSIDMPNGMRQYFFHGDPGVWLYHDMYFVSANILADMLSAQIFVMNDKIALHPPGVDLSEFRLYDIFLRIFVD